MRTRGIATRRGDAETVRKAREAHDQALHTRGGDDPVATSPETQKKKGGVSTSLTPPASFPPSPPLTVETDDKKTSPPASPVPARHANVAAQHPVTFTARGTPATWDTRQRVFQQSEGGSPERSESPASSAPNSPTHRDAPPDEASSKTRTVKFSRHVHGFRFTKAERGFLVSVFGRYDGKTPCRGTCEAVASAFAKSPARDPASRVPSEKSKTGEIFLQQGKTTVTNTTTTTQTTPQVALDTGPDTIPEAHARRVLGGAFRGAALRDAVDGYFPKPIAPNEPRETGTGNVTDQYAGNAAQYPSGDAAQYPSGNAAQYPSGNAAQYPSGDAAQYPSGDAAQYPSGNAAQYPSGNAAQYPSYPPVFRMDTSREQSVTWPITGGLSQRTPPPHPSGSARVAPTAAAIAPIAAAIGRVYRTGYPPQSCSTADIATWQPAGTAIFVGERAYGATPAMAKFSRASPSPTPSPPAANVPYLPEQPKVLASETIVSVNTPRRRGVGWDSDESNLPPSDGNGNGDGDGEGEGDCDGRLTVTLRAKTGHSLSSRHGVAGDADFGTEETNVLGGEAYLPGDTLDDGQGNAPRDDDLTAALSLGARTGRWIPLSGRSEDFDLSRYEDGTDDEVGDVDDPLRGLLEEALPGGSHKKAKGGKHKNNSSADVPSAAENAAMVAGAVSELGDGETHPVTWKQIKTWFENRRMTQKRIKEGAARPSRRYVPSRLGDEKERRRSADDSVRESDASGAAGRGTARGAPGTQARKSDTIRGKKAGTPTQTLANTPPTAPRTSRASLDETRFDSGGRVPHGVKRKMPNGQTLPVSGSPAAAVATATERLRDDDGTWGRPNPQPSSAEPSALTREMSWAEIHDALNKAGRRE